MTTPTDPLKLDPEELVYDSDYNMNQMRKLTLTNPSNSLHCVFKIKLSHRELYHVNPSVGTLAPSGSVTVEIVLRPMSWSQANADKNRILVQSLNTEDASADFKTISENGQMPMDQKINVVLPPPK